MINKLRFLYADLSGCIMVWHGRLSVDKACKHDTDWTVPVLPSHLVHVYTPYDKRTSPIDFQGQGSKVKVTHYTLLLNLVNTIQTEMFQLGPSNLVHTSYDKRTTATMYCFSRSGVKGRGHTLSIVVKPFKHDTDWIVSARSIKLGTHTSYDKRTTAIDFQGQGSKV